MPAARYLLLAHLVGVVLFYGNLVAAWLLYARAWRTDSPAVVAQLFAVVNLGDRWLTPFSTVLIVGTGVASARELGLPLFGTRWLLWSIVALAGSGLVFALRLLPLQRRLARMDTSPSDPAAAAVARREWARWALAATALAAIPLGLMVLKPGPALP